ncbi:hypothetical protein HBI56_177970 [Parastagonospora nodorum]|nr:hypothetical protein HBH53_244510 [Parastagonospora nodorum]KAH3973312.1 hypothetical protein HBH52_147120 [Parastagonospora nodorum]KAH4003946.1 hypothetical protein HBI10_054070 [Parastagonospora nodorum]KAH4017052.1 hypothetical protein HBI13_146900 [Parastagonospora nodorum]KAH4038269.1 hypothetical protein HBI09_049070 [Parastagonospora nodorum]
MLGLVATAAEARNSFQLPEFGSETAVQIATQLYQHAEKPHAKSQGWPGKWYLVTSLAVALAALRYTFLYYKGSPWRNRFDAACQRFYHRVYYGGKEWIHNVSILPQTCINRAGSI